jgi:hypothetical protein
MMDLPKIRDRIDMKNQYVDGTPDGLYALRILKFIRQRCNEKWIVEGFDESTTALYDAMNKHQDLRAKELDEAIRILSEHK